MQAAAVNSPQMTPTAQSSASLVTQDVKPAMPDVRSVVLVILLSHLFPVTGRGDAHVRRRHAAIAPHQQWARVYDD